jgi:hypothetical protein
MQNRECMEGLQYVWLPWWARWSRWEEGNLRRCRAPNAGKRPCLSRSHLVESEGLALRQEGATHGVNHSENKTRAYQNTPNIMQM